MMNQLIRELAESCTVDFVDGRGVSLSEIDVEKFAELIVSVCAGICFNEDYMCGADYGQAMLNRFGIQNEQTN